MRIFVAGAAGAIGRSLVRQLAAAGHVVVGLTRKAERAGLIRSLGGEPVVGDGLDRETMRRVIGSMRPDTVVHQMTDLATVTDLRRFDRTLATTNRLRVEGTDILLSAAHDAGVAHFVAQSYCGWPYAREGDPIKSEIAPLDPEPPGQLRRTLDAIRYLEGVVTGSLQPPGTVLRYGTFYGPGTGLYSDAAIAQLRRRRVPLVGNGNGWWSLVHVEDAAAATVRAIERRRPGIFNIADDEPAPVREWLPALASAIDAGPPRRVPAWLARLLTGAHVVAMMTEQRAGSNAKAREELNWQPVRASWRHGFAEVAAAQCAGAARVPGVQA